MFSVAGATLPKALDMDMFLFIPRNVGLAPQNYSKARFYSDVHALMRLWAQPLPLDRLVDLGSPSMPLHPIARALEQFRAGDELPSSTQLAVHVTLFAYLMTTATLADVNSLIALLQDQDRDAFIRELESFIASAERVLREYRRLRRALWPFEVLCHHSFNDALATADEYMSLFLEEQLARLSSAVGRVPGVYDGSAFAPAVRERVRRLAEREVAHRKRYGFLTHASDRKDLREYFVFRRSMLKKAVQKALYLDARDVESETFVRNSVGAFGAALAAVWAWATQLPVAVANLPTNTKLLFFLGAVAAYVAKDRIKSMTNEVLLKKLKKFDQTSRIRGASLEEVGLGTIDARLKERMSFRPFEELDEEIRNARLLGRSRDHLSPPPEEEKIIHYRKVLSVKSVKAGPLAEGYGVVDIVRLNVREFLSRLDDPTETLRCFDENHASFTHTKLPKVYHLNFIVRLRELENERTVSERIERVRVVLDKKGIVRLAKPPGRAELSSRS